MKLPVSPAQRAYDGIRGSGPGLAALSLIVGLGAGLGAIAFRYLIEWFTLLFTGQADYVPNADEPHPLLPALQGGFLVLAPVIGGLIYGPLINRFAREARGHGVPEVMLAVAERGGRIRPRVAIIKSLASAICIGSGGSVGREGPIVQIGSAIGSSLGQLVSASETRLRLLVSCGAAGGIAATFNAPIAGVMFGLELILRDFEAESVGVVVLSSVVASVVGRAAFGSQPFLSLPPFQLVSLSEYGLYAILGVASAFAGVAFIRALYGLEDLTDRIWKGPEWLRPGAGGICLGLLLFAIPQMYGVGYPVMEQAVSGGYSPWFTLLLGAAKIAATSLTIAIGGSGGVFAPSLFVGAMLGTSFGQAVHHLLPHATAPAGAYGLVGMGAVFAAAARAPITSAIIIFELTGEYRIILPLLLAIALSTSLAKVLSKDTIYTLKLRRRGVDISSPRTDNVMQLLSVREAMQPAPDGLPFDLPLGEAVERFAHDGRDALPVVDVDGWYHGVVTSRQVEEAVRDNSLDVPIGTLARLVPTVLVDEQLERALGALVHDDVPGIPVLDTDGRTVVGWLTHRAVLGAYQARRNRTGVMS